MTVENEQSLVTTLSAPDIMCGGCANAIRKAVGSVAGVEDVSVDIASKSVAVRHSTAVGEDSLAAALDRAGFPATVQAASAAKAISPPASCSCCQE